MSMTYILPVAVCVLAAMLMILTIFTTLQASRLRRLTAAVEADSSALQRTSSLSDQVLRTLYDELKAVQARLEHTIQRQQDLENRDAVDLTYEQASKLVQLGAATDDLVNSCGLSQSEARLVALMAARGIGRRP